MESQLVLPEGPRYTTHPEIRIRRHPSVPIHPPPKPFPHPPKKILPREKEPLLSALRADHSMVVSSRGRIKKLALVSRWSACTQGTLASAAGYGRAGLGVMRGVVGDGTLESPSWLVNRPLDPRSLVGSLAAQAPFRKGNGDATHYQGGSYSFHSEAAVCKTSQNEL
jgi:hypothetical protein